MKKGSWPKSFEIYQREPIRIHSHCVMLLQIFTRIDHLEDSWTWGEETVMESDAMIYQLASEQFRKQLEGRDCIAFWSALRNEADQVIAEWERNKTHIEQEIRTAPSQEGHVAGYGPESQKLQSKVK